MPETLKILKEKMNILRFLLKLPSFSDYTF